MTPLVWMNKYGYVASFKNEEYTDPLYTIPVEYKTEIERLHKEVEHLRQTYHRVKDDNELLDMAFEALIPLANVGIIGETTDITHEDVKKAREVLRFLTQRIAPGHKLR